MDGPEIRVLVDRATYLFTNEYERDLLCQKTGWSSAQVLDRVGTWITTYGAKGVTLESGDRSRVSVDAVAAGEIADPTGVGDAFRAGFCIGIGWGLVPERAAQVGCTLATEALEAIGPEDYDLDPSEFVQRVDNTHGPEAAADVSQRLRRR